MSVAILVSFLWVMCQADDYFYQPSNTSRSTLSGIEAYRSALTLDWLEAEDQRQRELARAFETEATAPGRTFVTDCIEHPRPASGKVARLMLELLKNLEGDDGTIIPEMIQSLIRAKMLVETSMLDAEPDLESLIKTPGIMKGEPHSTFPKILAMAWMTVTDPVTTKVHGWCPLQRVNRYLAVTKPALIASHMKALEPILARGRFIMEEFIQHVTPLNMYEKTTRAYIPTKAKPTAAVQRSNLSHRRTQRQPDKQDIPTHTKPQQMAPMSSNTTQEFFSEPTPAVVSSRRQPSTEGSIRSRGFSVSTPKLLCLFICTVFVL